MSNPSLILPQSPAYGEDYVYAAQVNDGVVPLYNVLPLTFTRASNGTRINKDGILENMPYNLLSDSNTFNAGWAIGIGGGSLGSFVTDPFGGTTARVLNLNNNGIFYNSSVSPYPTTISTTSIWMRTQSGSVSIQLGNPIGSPYYTKTITTTWTRFDIQVDPSSYNGGIALYNSVHGSSITIEIFGAQVNIGSTAKPYLATTDRLNMPRITYPVGGGCGALLLEKQSTNLTLYSEQFDNAVHYKLDVTITANNITSPDGTQNADKFTETTGTGEHIVYDIDSNATGTYTLSAFFKGGEGTIYPVLRLNGSTTTAYAGCIFNTSTGAVVNTFYNTYSAPTTKVENMGNGWYRVSMTTTTTDANFGMRIAASNSASPSIGAFGAISYTGSTSNYFYVYGAQLEASSYATSYIPTTSTSATRIQDQCYKTGISNLIGQTQGTLYADIDFIFNNSTTNQDTRIWSIWDNSNEVVSIWARDNNLRYQYYDSGASVNLEANMTTTEGRNKVAIAYNGTNLKVYKNGVQILNTTMSATANLICNSVGSGNFWGSAAIQHSVKINNAQIYNIALSASELATLTTI